MISIKNLSKRYGTRMLFDDVNFDVLAGEKVGLVGRNGSGKTTLFRIITGEEEPEQGKVFRPNNYVIGYLGQHLTFTKPTVLEEGCKGLGPEDLGAEWKVEKVLSGLGFTEKDFKRSPSEFSGGFQMRIALAKVLVSEPNMLLLDEPTNFLDIVSIRWLEKFLRSWKGEVIVISHDRDLVDSVTTHIVGIHRGRVRKMKGATAKYYAQLRKDEEVHEKRRLEDEKKRKQIMEYVNTFRAKASHAKAVQSNIKKLEKMEKLEKLEEIYTLAFSFNYKEFRAQQIMDVNDLTFSYEGKEPYLISGLNFTVNRHDKIGIVGKNGKGKTTLLKLLSGRLKPVAGSVKTHTAALPAYYEQANTADLNDELTVEEEITPRGAFIDRARVRGICGAMMFPGDDAEKKVKILSGGERSRVLLGKILVAPSNILFLDEPTHHLDIESCQAMMDAVRDFDGAALVVAHDEHFLNEVATKLIVFKNDRVFLYPGSYREFLDSVGWEEGEANTTVLPSQNVPSEKSAAPAVIPLPAPPVPPKSAAKGHSGKMSRKVRAELVAARSKILKPLEAKIKSLEDEIVSSEAKAAAMNRELAKTSVRGGPGAIRRSELSRELKELTERIDACYAGLEAATKEYDAAKLKYSGQ
ncbi:MAG: ABC-F family ATP-binding cassette domain-containing protein [Candidatus Omnitrophica bacterium]|nr:ABC-F family ATP-binding cassette domain-containing protein [Candidatus Omnitrophota bacterium]MDD5437393.1 ABC-F family ATP-binding cassette domain-containing protein [Candidatus Omnitrophota bacterium]